MDTWKVTSIQVLSAVTFNEVDVTPVVDTSIQHDSVALGVVGVKSQQDTLTSPGLEVSLLQLHRGVDNDLAAPHSQMLNSGLDSCE
jgi:hypothetical protein